MRQLKLASALLVLTTLSWAAPPGKLDFPPLKYSPPKIERAVLKCGATVFLLPDHELPLINLSAMVRTGSMFEPADKTGLAGLAGSLLRGGGTLTRSREEMDELLEFIGASVETGMDVESAAASLSCLKKDFSKTLGIFSDVLQNPAFSVKKLEIEKAKVIEAIRRRNDEPFDIARRQYRLAIYGPSHPLSRTPEIPEIRSISRADLAEFHKKYYKPGNMMIAVSGDFESAEMIRSLDSAFSGWTGGSVEFPKVEGVNPQMQARAGARQVICAEKDLNQSSLILGHLGIKRHNPDRFALEIMNEILGGNSFTSRLYKEIRTRLGLAYWVGSNFSEPWDLGTLAAGCQTKSQTLGKTARTVLAEMKRITQEEETEAELKFAKDSTINSFVFRFATPHAIVSQKMSLEYFGFPADYLETYTGKIRRVSAGDVLAAAKKYLHPDKMVLVAVGNKKDFDVPLEEFGQVKTADLTIAE